MSKDAIAQRLTIQQCQCGRTLCNMCGFKEGTFYQGNGFNKATAERVAECYNLCAQMDSPTEVIHALQSLARDVVHIDAHHPQRLATRAEEILSHIRR